MRREKFLENYRKKIQKMNISELLFEFDSVRKKINPRCKRWDFKNGNITMYKYIDRPKAEKISCKDCKYCTVNLGKRGRACYICDNPKRTTQNSAKEEGFICFEDAKTRKPRIKTSPSWCPLKCEN